MDGLNSLKGMVVFLITLIGLSLAHHKLSGEIFFADLANLLNPALNADLFDPAQVVHLHIVGIGRSTIGGWCQQRAGEFITVTAQLNAFFFALLWQMKMFPVLGTAPLAGDRFFGYAIFLMNQLGQFIGDVGL